MILGRPMAMTVMSPNFRQIQKGLTDGAVMRGKILDSRPTCHTVLGTGTDNSHLTY
jgi:hypothetical protein